MQHSNFGRRLAASGQKQRPHQPRYVPLFQRLRTLVLESNPLVRSLLIRHIMKSVGEPDVGNPHVRFDERGWETERCRMAQATAPILDSTLATLRCDTSIRLLLGVKRTSHRSRERGDPTRMTHLYLRWPFLL